MAEYDPSVLCRELLGARSRAYSIWDGVGGGEPASHRRGRRQIIVRGGASVEAETLVIAFSCLWYCL